MAERLHHDRLYLAFAMIYLPESVNEMLLAQYAIRLLLLKNYS